MSAPPARKLNARRGSVTASDPWGAHSQLNLNPNRSSSSTLTIVRVLPPQSAQEQYSSPIQRRYSSHRRLGSYPSSASNQDPARLSFAFSSFGTTQASGGPANSHPPGPPSPHIRPSSPNQRQGSYLKPRLTPDQLLELARQSTSPSFRSHNDAPHSPVLPPRSHSPLNPQASGTSSVIAPATFTPLPPSIYLPFIDRPSEVASLISSPPSAKLFSLLAQTFPPNSISSEPDFSTDPTTWSFAQLTAWLTQVNREAAPDALWVLNARRCILSRSELIWERVKGALGIPPELDNETLLSGDDDVFESESDTSSNPGFAEKMGGGGGTWYDWDVVANSPIAEHSSPPRSATPFDQSGPHLSPPSGLTISPVVAPHPAQTTSTTSLPPLSLPSALAQDIGLQEISEDVEENEDASPSDVNADAPNAGQDNPQPQIHGLRISTAPFPSSLLHSPTTPPTFSDLVFSRHPDISSSALSSRSGSFSSLAGRRSMSFGGRSGSAFGQRRTERRANSVVERGAGNPLFPGSFAQLGDDTPFIHAPTLPKAV